MKITKRQLRRIIKEELAITGGPAAGPNLGRQWIDVVMDELATGDVDMAADAIMNSFWLDDTWSKEEEALEDMLASLGTNPSAEEVNAVAVEWLDGYRAGNFRPSEDEMDADWTGQSQRAKVKSQKRTARWNKGVNEQKLRDVVRKLLFEDPKRPWGSYSEKKQDYFRDVLTMSPNGDSVLVDGMETYTWDVPQQLEQVSGFPMSNIDGDSLIGTLDKQMSNGYVELSVKYENGKWSW